jgi:hypothetical protein
MEQIPVLDLGENSQFVQGKSLVSLSIVILSIPKVETFVSMQWTIYFTGV